MPDAIKNSGLLVGTIGLVILSILCVSCMHMLVNCAHTLGVRTRKPHMTYADTAEYAFSTSGPIPRRFSTTARLVVYVYIQSKNNISHYKISILFYIMLSIFQDHHQYLLMYHTTRILLCILRICGPKFAIGKFQNGLDIKLMYWFQCSYTAWHLKIGHALEFQVISHHFGTVNLHVMMAITLIPMLLLCSIRNLKYLSPISMLANILQMVGLGLVFFYLLQALPATWERKAYADW